MKFVKNKQCCFATCTKEQWNKRKWQKLRKYNWVIKLSNNKREKWHSNLKFVRKVENLMMWDIDLQFLMTLISLRGHEMYLKVWITLFNLIEHKTFKLKITKKDFIKRLLKFHEKLSYWKGKKKKMNFKNVFFTQKLTKSPEC